NPQEQPMAAAFHENTVSSLSSSSSSCVFSSLSLDNVLGISPVRLLCERSKLSSLSRSPKLCGIDPENSLLERTCFDFFQFTARLNISCVLMSMNLFTSSKLKRNMRRIAEDELSFLSCM
ncbi:hypothetical protein CARUB_v10002276mg, partial [Capsella rubella]